MKHFTNGALEILVEKSEPTMVVPEEDTPRGFYFLSNLDQNKIRLNPNGRDLDMNEPEDRRFLLVSLEENIGMVVSTIYCFKSKDKGNEDAARVLKESLSRVLVPFYPLAGRLRASSDGMLGVECTGEGAVFVEAEADCRLEEIGDLMDPDPTNRGKLVYDFYLNKPKTILDIPLIMVQVTKFKCGGFILGMTMNHAMFDGIGATSFVKAWGQMARGLPLKNPPFLDRTLLRSRSPPRIDFPHPEFQEMPPRPTSVDQEEEELEHNTFVLDAKRIERLKYKAMEDGVLDRCTTFEVLTAFAWKARTMALRKTDHHDDNETSTRLVFPVDGRPRFNPPLPAEYFGNAIVMATCECTEAELARRPLSYAVGKVQRAIEGVNDEFMRSAIDYYEVKRARPSMRSVLLVTTWARLSFYQTDFGWGDPVHTGPVGVPGKEVVMILANGGEREMSTSMLVALPAAAMDRFRKMLQEIM